VPQLEHLLLDLDRSASRTSPWTRGPVDQAGIALSFEAGDPAVRALPRNTKFLRDMSNRAAITDHSINEQTTTMDVQTSVSVGHEGLLVCEDVRYLH
jgi:hypothetical protein